jgi:hypothetical protein
MLPAAPIASIRADNPAPESQKRGSPPFVLMRRNALASGS